MDLENLRAFVAVAEQGSFSAGARGLGLAKSTVSQRVSDLEESLGVKLITRTTRSMSVTDAGEELHRRGADIMRLSAEAEGALTAGADEVRGAVRLSAPVSLGLRFLGPVVSKLTREYPGLSLTLDLSDHAQDLVESRFDLALRIGEVTQTGLIVKKLGRARRLVVGSPEYFQGRPRLCSPEDLKRHDCLTFSFQKYPDRWTFQTQAGTSHVRVAGPLEANNGDLLAELSSQGVGLAWLPEFIVASLIKDGRLQVALAEDCASTLPVVILYPEKRYRPLKVRVVADAIQSALEGFCA